MNLRQTERFHLDTEYRSDVFALWNAEHAQGGIAVHREPHGLTPDLVMNFFIDPLLFVNRTGFQQLIDLGRTRAIRSM